MLVTEAIANKQPTGEYFHTEIVLSISSILSSSVRSAFRRITLLRLPGSFQFFDCLNIHRLHFERKGQDGAQSWLVLMSTNHTTHSVQFIPL